MKNICFIQFENGRCFYNSSYLKELPPAPMPAAAAAELLVNGKTATIERDQDYLCELCIELCLLASKLEKEFVTLDQRFGGHDIFGKIHNIKKCVAFLEMEALSVRRSKYIS